MKKEYKGDAPLSIVIVGASGDLAQKKIFPALFSLYAQGFLPSQFHCFGFARTDFTDEQFRRKTAERLARRRAPNERRAGRVKEFLERCSYVAGQYASSDSFLDLYEVMREKEEGRAANRVFDLAIPPSVFLDVAQALGNAGLVECGTSNPWSRVVIEKPFGRDRPSSDLLTREMARVFSEEQTYRIDHYLGKEVIQNLLVLRFANLVFHPLWNKDFIERVDIVWKEDISAKGRAGYFDDYGIIRDVLQNHLLQILALVAMEPPDRFTAVHIANAKTNLLRSIQPLKADDILLGQYEGYRREDGVSEHSRTPTYASARLQVDNDRWRGTPFFITAGKGLDARMTEVRITFRNVPGNIFCEHGGCPEANELIIRVQPDEAILLRVANKAPGMTWAIETKDLNLRYESAFDAAIPDAYESLLLDVITGDRSLFIRKDELASAWDVVTPVLSEIDERQWEPEWYKFGSRGPGFPERSG